MAKYDERGVIIPAPVQGHLSGERYDDEHRGPAVTEAYSLSRCWIDLAEHSRNWPEPDSIPDHLHAISQNHPPESRDGWLKDAANREVMEKLLSYALQSGELPVWVAPLDGPEKPVPAESILEMDHATMVSGTYRPPHDRGSLHGRPLFIKWNDWVQFVATTNAEKEAERLPDPDQEKLPRSAQFVTLSEALSWIAFRVSMRDEKLFLVMSRSQFGERKPETAISAALVSLADAAKASAIELRGKLQEHRDIDPDSLLTRPIEPIAFEDFRRFSILEDGLRYGEGLTAWKADEAVWEHATPSQRRERFVSITVERDALLRLFPPTSRLSDEAKSFGVAKTFTRDDPATIAPWWSVNLVLAWIACGITSYVEHVGKLETELFQGEARLLMAQVTVECDLSKCDEAKVFKASRHAVWPEGAILAHAGRALLEKILVGEVRPMARENGHGRQMQAEDFVGIGAKESGGDWLDLDPQPLFASADIMRVFPAMELGPDGNGKGKVPANRQLDYEKILERVREMRAERPGLTKGSAAASIVAELPPNPKTGKPRDQRGIEKIIAHLWEGKA